MGNPVLLPLWCVASRVALPAILDPKGFSLSLSSPIQQHKVSLLPKERDMAESLLSVCFLNL